MASYIYHNNFKTTLTVTLLVGGVSATVDAATPLVTPPAGKTLHLTLISASDSSVVEIIAVTAVTGNVFAITRAREGSVAREWPIGTKVEARVTAAMLTDMAAVDSTGNARGTNAIDLQSGRDSADRVAGGIESAAVGFNNILAGNYAVAVGRDNDVSGQYGVAIGSGNSVEASSSNAIGVNNIIEGGWSNAVGFGNEILGASTRGYAFGYENTVSGGALYGFAAGRENLVSGNYGIAAGYLSAATASSTIAIGHVAAASSSFGIAIGPAASAAGSISTAIGSTASVTEPSQLTVWPATTAVFFGSTYRLAANSGLILYCIRAGTTGASEPTPSGAGTVVDGTATWSVIDVLSGGGSKAQAFGSSANAVGSLAVSLGGDSIARGHSSIAIGGQAKALGRNAIAIGPSAEAHGSGSIVLGRASIGDRARATPGVTMIGSEKYTAFAYASHIRGLEFVDQHNWWYNGGVSAVMTAQHTTREVTLYSPIPVQLGNAAWPGAAATVQHGYSIRVGSYIYTAFIYNSDYFDSGTTGGTEPVWPTTPGDDVADGDFDWICVGTSIEWLMPDYARFVPVSVGAIARTSVPGGGVTYPQITAGINGDLDKWLAATTLSKLTGNYSQHLVEPTNTEGAKQFGIALTTAGGDLNCVAVLVVKGYVVESEVA